MENAPDTEPTPKPRRRRKWMRRLGWSMVGLVALYGLFVGMENWRGDRAWKCYLAEMKAKGEPMSAEALLPPPVPDEQNFWMAPLFRVNDGGRTAASDTDEPTAYQELKAAIGTFQPFRPSDKNNWRHGARIDLKDWQKQYRAVPESSDSSFTGDPARDVFKELTKFDVVLDALREAGSRPEFRLPSNHVDSGLPFALLRRIALLTEMRAICQLAMGDVEGAYQDLRLTLRLAKSVENDPILVSRLFQIVLRELTIQPLWEGITRHQWTDTQLSELQVEFAEQNFARAFQRALRGELLLYGFPLIDKFKGDRSALKEALAFDLSAVVNPTAGERSIWHPIFSATELVPRGWFDQNKVAMGRLYQELIETVDEESIGFRPEQVEAIETRLAAPVRIGTPYQFLSRLAGQTAIFIQGRCAYAQGLSDLALCAVTLERYRLRYGRYPAALSEIDADLLAAGRGIPEDCITGSPPHYEPTGDSFVLYYEGWNGRDDGGKESRASNGRGQIRPKEGDWVWPQLRQP